MPKQLNGTPGTKQPAPSVKVRRERTPAGQKSESAERLKVPATKLIATRR
jgi:hypothetical protein